MSDTSNAARAARSGGRTRELVQAALLAALLCVTGFLAVPLGFTPVPLTFQIFVVVLCALLLSPAMAASAVGIYLLLGAAGVPVFAGGEGGMGVLAGPKGGFLVGFMIGAFLGAIVREYLSKRTARLLADSVASLTVLAVTYVLGWVQLMIVTHLGPAAAALAGVAPFVVIDLIKAAAAVGVAGALRRANLVAA